MDEDLRILLRLGAAVAMSAPLGWDRERRNRPAGLRTHMLIGLSAALIVSLAEPILEFVQADGQSSYDPLRLTEAVVAGVAFLGAGTIVIGKRSGNVHGLTTAASLLATASIGMACGVERYVLAVGTTALVVVVLIGLGWVEDRIGSGGANDPDEVEDVEDPKRDG